MLLIYPPIAKASEPPCGIAILAGGLKAHNIHLKVLDMNIGAQEYLLDQYFKKNPKKENYRKLIRKSTIYKNPQKYQRIISELSRGLNNQANCEDNNVNTISLANFETNKYDPLNSKDLLNASKNYKESPFYEYYKKSLAPILSDTQIGHVGISLQFINQAVSTFTLIGYIKANYPKIKIILGGGLITSWSTLINWNDPFKSVIDLTIPGPGEEKLLEYLGCKPNPEKLKNMKPDYSWLINVKYYSPGLIMPISASVGCSWKRCKFCPELAEDTKYIPPKNNFVLQLIRHLEKEYRPSLFHFLDNEISPSLLKTLAFSKMDTPWYGFTKFYPLLKNYDFCLALKNSSCTMLKLGLESGDQKVLNSINKGIVLDDVKIILKNLKSAGIKTYIYILLGTPVEDYNSARKTMNFIEEHSEKITFLNVAIFNMPINNNEFAINNIFHYSDADLSLYKGFKHPLGWNRAEIRKFLKEEFNQNPWIREIIKRTPPQFNSNHAPFLTTLNTDKTEGIKYLCL